MVTKRVQIEFADPRIKAVDYIQDIRKAAANAGLNLYSRHNVQLQIPKLEGDRVVLELKIPDELSETFAIGNHLRGLSNFLLSNWKERYQPYLFGKRLIYFRAVNDSDATDTDLQMVDRLEAIALFAKLLERNDEEGKKMISQILEILKEAKQPWE